MRKRPRSIRRCVDVAADSGRRWSRSNLPMCCRLASSSDASHIMTRCEIASGAFKASGGRAWISLCNDTRQGCCTGCDWFCMGGPNPIVATSSKARRSRQQAGRGTNTNGTRRCRRATCRRARRHSSTNASWRLALIEGSATTITISAAMASKLAESPRVTKTLQSPRESNNARRRFSSIIGPRI